MLSTVRDTAKRAGKAGLVFWVLVQLILTLFSAPAGHARPESAEATPKREWVACKSVTESREDGENQQVTATVMATFSGMLKGRLDATEREVVRKNGSRSFSGSGTFVGEINGHAGTAIMTYTGTVDAKEALTGNWVLDKGTDELARIDGQGTFAGKPQRPAPNECGDTDSQSSWNGTYSGTAEFAR
jgi:hypothetical protein